MRSVERIKHKKIFESLFQMGKHIKFAHLSCIWAVGIIQPFPVQMAVSVPKKRHKHAVTRNLLKRRIKEVYRVHKGELYQAAQPEKGAISILFLYQTNKILKHAEIEQEVIHLLKKVKESVALVYEEKK